LPQEFDHVLVDSAEGLLGRWRLMRATFKYARQNDPMHVHLADIRLPVAFGLAAARTPFSVSVHVHPGTWRAQVQVTLAGLLCRRVFPVTQIQEIELHRRCHIPFAWMTVQEHVVAMPMYVHRDRPVRTRLTVVSRSALGKGLEHLSALGSSALEHGVSVTLFTSEASESEGELETPGIAVRRGVTDTEELFRETDVLVVLSPDEVGPTVALEAAVRGVPTVSLHPLPSLDELLGELRIVSRLADSESVVCEVVERNGLHNGWPSARALHGRVAVHYMDDVGAARFLSSVCNAGPAQS
jgi:hypothetical protein